MHYRHHLYRNAGDPAGDYLGTPVEML
jgi:hypothetical protein